jgi:hypothetical protein
MLPLIPFQLSSLSVHSNAGNDTPQEAQAAAQVRGLEGKRTVKREVEGLEHCHPKHSFDFYLWPQYNAKN